MVGLVISPRCTVTAGFLPERAAASPPVNKPGRLLSNDCAAWIGHALKASGKNHSTVRVCPKVENRKVPSGMPESANGNGCRSGAGVESGRSLPLLSSAGAYLGANRSATRKQTLLRRCSPSTVGLSHAHVVAKLVNAVAVKPTRIGRMEIVRLSYSWQKLAGRLQYDVDAHCGFDPRRRVQPKDSPSTVGLVTCTALGEPSCEALKASADLCAGQGTRSPRHFLNTERP